MGARNTWVLDLVYRLGASGHLLGESNSNGCVLF